MSKKNNAATPSRSSTRVDAQILEFANSNLTLEPLTQRAIFFLTTFKALPRNVLGLTPGDQDKFVDKIDQVRQHLLLGIMGPSLLQRHFVLWTRKMSNTYRHWEMCAVRSNGFRPQLYSPQDSKNVGILLWLWEGSQMSGEGIWANFGLLLKLSAYTRPKT